MIGAFVEVLEKSDLRGFAEDALRLKMRWRQCDSW